MKNRVIVSVVLAMLLPATVIAQSPPREGSCLNTCDFPAEVVDSAEKLHQQTREAEVAVREYVEDSVGTIERGSARALRDFSAWYQYRVSEQNKRKLQNRAIGELIQHALSAALNIFLPGNGAVAKRLREYSVKAYAFVLSTAPSGTDNALPYLERVAVDLLNGKDRLRNMTADMFHNTSDRVLREQMQAIRLEYVLEKEVERENAAPGAGERTPGPDTRRLLHQLGVADPGTNTYETTREEVLDNMIYSVMCAQDSSNIFRCPADGWYFEALSKSAARRLVFSNADPRRMFNITDRAALERICPAERPLDDLMRSNDCRRWFQQ